MHQWISFVLSLMMTIDASVSQLSCDRFATCSDCIKAIECVWCLKPISGANCIDKTVAHRCKNPIDPAPVFEILQDDAFQSGPVPVQIKPQRVRLSLRKDATYTVRFQYKSAKNYPVDLYYLMDVSASMERYKRALALLGRQLTETMMKNTNDFRIGFGTFIDKPTAPYVSQHPDRLRNPCTNRRSKCTPAYSYRHHMSLDADHERFSRMVNDTPQSGNIDAPEGGFDALMQAMVCDRLIGWRNHSRHLIVYSTDAYYHAAGDGKLGGAVLPNDGRCHTRVDAPDGNDAAALIYDYPSVSHINHVAKRHNVNLFFAIDKSAAHIYATYKQLSRVVENSEIGDIRTDIDKLIDKFYRSLVQTVEFKTESPNYIEVNYGGDCGPSNRCTNVSYDEAKTIDLHVRVRATRCTNATETIRIRPGALSESLVIELTPLCDCPCDRPQNVDYRANANACSGGRGDLRCGVCVCHAGYVGRNCECDSSKLDAQFDDDSVCRKDATSPVCSGRGTCKCGTCVCKRYDQMADADAAYEISGKYCECDNYSCQRGKGSVLCSGRGACVCGRCECLPGWSGDACGCRNATDTCMAPSGDDGGAENSDVQLLCSGNGECVCGECVCKADGRAYAGRYCADGAVEAAKRCRELFPCVRCKAFDEGDYDADECRTRCARLNVTVVDTIITDSNQDDGELSSLGKSDNAKICRLADAGCTVVYRYYVDRQHVVEVQKEKICSFIGNVYALVGIVVGSVLLAGLLMLLLWKVFTSVHDRREYARFEMEMKKAKWSRAENPLYKGAVSHFNNPTFGK